jgi:hypothetical protein
VTPYNYDKLQRLVDNGPHPPPGETGAKFIIRDDGSRRDLNFLTNAADRVLQIGYTVRHDWPMHCCFLCFLCFSRSVLHRVSLVKCQLSRYAFLGFLDIVAAPL